MVGIPSAAQLDIFTQAPAPERQVGQWILRNDVPVERDKQERHHAKAQRPEFPFAAMRRGESFVVYPHDLAEDDLLRTANVVSSAASAFKKRRREDEPPEHVDFKTAQIGGRFVRCWRIA